MGPSCSPPLAEGRPLWPAVVSSQLVGAAWIWIGQHVGRRRRPTPHLLHAGEGGTPK